MLESPPNEASETTSAFSHFQEKVDCEAVQEFRHFVRDHLVKGIATSGAPHQKFLPFPDLSEYLTGDNSRNMHQLLAALYTLPDQDLRSISSAILDQECVILFAILLMISAGHLVAEFLPRDGSGLNDDHLPLQGPAPGAFQRLSSERFGQSLYRRFKNQQWIFLPMTIKLGSEKVEFERILPITRSEPIGSTSNSNTVLIQIHPAYNRLTTPEDSVCQSYYSCVLTDLIHIRNWTPHLNALI